MRLSHFSDSSTVQSHARLRSKSSPLASVSALRRLWEANACLRDNVFSRAGSVVRRWDSAAVSFRLRSVADFYMLCQLCERGRLANPIDPRKSFLRTTYSSSLQGFEPIHSLACFGCTVILCFFWLSFFLVFRSCGRRFTRVLGRLLGRLLNRLFLARLVLGGFIRISGSNHNFLGLINRSIVVTDRKRWLFCW